MALLTETPKTSLSQPTVRTILSKKVLAWLDEQSLGQILVIFFRGICVLGVVVFFAWPIQTIDFMDWLRTVVPPSLVVAIFLAPVAYYFLFCQSPLVAFLRGLPLRLLELWHDRGVPDMGMIDHVSRYDLFLLILSGDPVGRDRLVEFGASRASADRLLEVLEQQELLIRSANNSRVGNPDLEESDILVRLFEIRGGESAPLPRAGFTIRHI